MQHVLTLWEKEHTYDLALRPSSSKTDPSLERSALGIGDGLSGALRISWPAWGLDGRRRPTTYAFTVDPKTRRAGWVDLPRRRDQRRSVEACGVW